MVARNLPFPFSSMRAILSSWSLLGVNEEEESSREERKNLPQHVKIIDISFNRIMSSPLELRSDIMGDLWMSIGLWTRSLFATAVPDFEEDQTVN